MPIVEETKAQKRFKDTFGEHIPPKPVRVSDRNWRMFVDHIRHGLGYEQLAGKYLDETTGARLTRSRTSQIVARALDWAIKEENYRQNQGI